MMIVGSIYSLSNVFETFLWRNVSFLILLAFYSILSLLLNWMDTNVAWIFIFHGIKRKVYVVDYRWMVLYGGLPMLLILMSILIGCHERRQMSRGLKLARSEMNFEASFCLNCLKEILSLNKICSSS